MRVWSALMSGEFYITREAGIMQSVFALFSLALAVMVLWIAGGDGGEPKCSPKRLKYCQV